MNNPFAITRWWLIIAGLIPGAAPSAAADAFPAVLVPPETAPAGSTFCNPLNLDYRFMIEKPSRREAADPLIVPYKGDYYLFASKSGGYWWSSDLLHWTLVDCAGDKPIRVEGYGPAAAVINGELYYTQQLDAFYKSTDPKANQWTRVRGGVGKSNDDWLFVDDDGRVYLYGVGFDPRAQWVQEFDPKDSLKLIGQPTPCVNLGPFDPTRPFPTNETIPAQPDYPGWEGPQMTKHNGFYYLQISHNPRLFFTDYAGEAFVGCSPRGPFRELPNNPISYRPVGFNSGAANCGWFCDKLGQWWNVATVSVGCFHHWERRVALYPSEFDKDTLMFSDTYLADLPQSAPGHRQAGLGGNLVGWMLLSYKKPARASSSIAAGSAYLPHYENKPPYRFGGPELAFDEDIRSWWSARTADKDEWLAVDLLKRCRINAIQVNFAEQDTTALGRRPEDELYHQYTLEVSDDGQSWRMLVDKSANRTDVPHDYIQLERPVLARHLRLTNVHMPGHGKFALRDLRVFGSGLGRPPEPVREFSVERANRDTASATLRWSRPERAEGFVVRWGIAPDKLYESQDVRERESATIDKLHAGVDYYFIIDSFNDSGLARGIRAKGG